MYGDKVVLTNVTAHFAGHDVKLAAHHGVAAAGTKRKKVTGSAADGAGEDDA